MKEYPAGFHQSQDQYHAQRLHEKLQPGHNRKSLNPGPDRPVERHQRIMLQSLCQFHSGLY